eukprot:scaffold158230_cov23-Tisochrysis_lutea.AAC.1
MTVQHASECKALSFLGASLCPGQKNCLAVSPACFQGRYGAVGATPAAAARSAAWAPSAVGPAVAAACSW